MNISRTRALWRLLPLLALLLLLTACGGGGLPSQEENQPQQTTLVYGRMSATYQDQMAAAAFMERYPDICIEIRDYSEYEDGFQQLAKELIAGNGPDILDLGNGSIGRPGLPYRQLVKAGYLEDLWPWIEGDPWLGPDSLMEAPIKAVEIDNGLYIAFDSVSIRTLVGAEDVVGNRYSWSLADVQAALAAAPEGSTVLQYFIPRQDIFYYLFSMSMDRYVDWDAGTCSFDSDSFRSALAFCNCFPTKVEVPDWAEADVEATQRLASGRQLVSFAIISDFDNVQMYDQIFGTAGGRASFVGFPVEDGDAGSYFCAGSTRLAMNAACRDKDAAWAFIRQVFMPRHKRIPGIVPLSSTSNGFPVNRSDFTKMANAAMIQEENRELSLSGFKVKIGALTEEDLQRFMDFYNSIERIDLYDNGLWTSITALSG